MLSLFASVPGSEKEARRKSSSSATSEVAVDKAWMLGCTKYRIYEKKGKENREKED